MTEPRPVRLTEQQRQIHYALSEKSPLLSNIFLGYAQIMSEEDNSDRLPLAAFSLRELQKNLPKFFDVTVEARVITLGDKFTQLKRLCRRAQEKSKAYLNGTWMGLIDAPLQTFLDSFVKTVRWHDEQKASFRNEIGELYRKIDPRQTSNSPTIEALRFAEWNRLNKFFNNVAHHNETKSVEEFQKNASRFEGLLLDALRPKTFQDFDKIDKLLERYP